MSSAEPPAGKDVINSILIELFLASMDEFTTVFLYIDVARDQYRVVYFSVFICAIFAALAFFYIRAIRAIGKQSNLTERKPATGNASRLLALAFCVFWAVMFVIYFVFWLKGITGNGNPTRPSTFGSPEYTELQRIYNAQQYFVAEGFVHVLHAQNFGGHEEGDIIRIGDVELEIDYFTITFGYNQTISHGGALTEGTYARVFYIENPPNYSTKYIILRVDIKNK